MKYKNTFFFFLSLSKVIRLPGKIYVNTRFCVGLFLYLFDFLRSGRLLYFEMSTAVKGKLFESYSSYYEELLRLNGRIKDL